MTTHRSLNKLEFKAHMSIHNTVDVPEKESVDDTNHTRDRFGRKHKISVKDRAAVALVSICFLVVSPVLAATGGTNITVESEPLSLNDRPAEKEKPLSFYRDGDTEIGINENGDPNLSMRY